MDDGRKSLIVTLFLFEIATNLIGSFVVVLAYVYLFDSEEVPQEYTKAKIAYVEAAEQGDALAQSQLGFMYAMGQGVFRNYAEAAKWYRKAAEQGHSEAIQWLGKNAKEKGE